VPGKEESPWNGEERKEIIMSEQTRDAFQHNSHERGGTGKPEERSASGQAAQALADCLHGTLILPEDAEYEAARQVWNGAVNRFPALIACCESVEDVIAALNVAREQALPLSVRSGGHSLAGHSTNDGGIVIDLSQMKGLSIDPTRRVARIEPGLSWGEVSNALQPHGLALTAGDTATVGVGGLMLGGGIGWMVRKEGLAIDHLRAVELVTADGRFLRASADEHPDLFWGLRGGGGNFGIATAFEVDLHPGGIILGGAVFYEATELEPLLQGYARITQAASDELTTQVLLMPAPPAPFIPPDKQGMPALALLLCYAGDPAEGERIVAPLRTLGPILADLVAPMPYAAIFHLAEIAEVRGLQHHLRSQFFDTASEEMLHTLAEATSTVWCRETLIQLRVLGGAMSRVESAATAFAHREKQAMLMISHYGPPTADARDLRARTEQVWQALAPYANGVYVNMLGDEGEQRLHEAYPLATYARLAALKRRYDPTNLFRLNQNIKPAEA
jgi:FAD/FMN-containing dehydrogenase